MRDDIRIGVIGGSGWLGRAIIRAILDAGLIAPDQLGVSFRSSEPTGMPEVFKTPDAQALIDRSDVVVLSVRPADWPAIRTSAAGKLVISVMAGIRIEQLMTRLRSDRVVRAMPNVAADVGWSFTPWVATAATTASDRTIVTKIFGACGTCDEVATEAELDYLTGLSGSGPAFPALLAEALRRDAVSRGLNPDVARRAATALLIGAGRLLEKSQQCPSKIVEEFVEYRGTTAAAINAMRASGFETSISKGLEAALRKSVSMGNSS